MALKPDREIVLEDISKFMPTVGNRGGVVSATGTIASGAAMDQSVNQVWYNTNAASATVEEAMGMLMVDVVNVDLTRQILNPFKSEAQINDKVVLMRKGWAVTNMVDTTASAQGAVAAGKNAYLIGSGFLSTATGIAGNPANKLVGRFDSAADEDGYYKVYIDL